MWKYRFLSFCNASEESRILEFNQYGKSDRKPSLIYWKIIKKIRQIRIKKLDECKNNPWKLPATRVSENIFCWYSMSTIWKFGGDESKYDV